MALPAAGVVEIRSVSGSDNNGGGWTGGGSGTDYSQSNTPILSVTDAVTTGTTTVSSATGGFTVAMVDNWLNVVGDGIYRIVSRTSTNAVVVDRATGTGTAQTCNVGGAWATLGKAAATMVASNKGFATTSGGGFTTTATISFAASNTPQSGAGFSRIIGYGSTRNDGSQATLALQTNTGLTALNATGIGWSFEYLAVDCASLGTSTGISLAEHCQVLNCLVKNFSLQGVVIKSGTASHSVLRSEITGGISPATSAINVNQSGWQGSISECFIHDNACTGVVGNESLTVTRCLIVNNSGASSDGIAGRIDLHLKNNTIHGNGRHGINVTDIYPINNEIKGNLLTSNGGYGFVGASSAVPASFVYDGNAYFNNTSGTRHNADSVTGVDSVNPYTNVLDVILTGSPYVGPTTGSSANFALNTTAGAGAACRAGAPPSTWPGNSGTTSFGDMGAVQHQDPPGGRGGQLLIVQGGITATV